MKEIRIEGGRQSGRTSLLIDIAKIKLERHNKVIFIVRDKNEERNIRRQFETDDGLYKTIFKNFTIITNPTQLVGMSADVVIIDDAERIKKEDMVCIIEPVVAVPNGVIYSTWLRDKK